MSFLFRSTDGVTNVSRFIRRRAKEAREREERDRIMKEQWRRQEEARLNALPVSARIIVQPQKPKVIPRIGEFDFPVRYPFPQNVVPVTNVL